MQCEAAPVRPAGKESKKSERSPRTHKDETRERKMHHVNLLLLRRRERRRRTRREKRSFVHPNGGQSHGQWSVAYPLPLLNPTQCHELPNMCDRRTSATKIAHARSPSSQSEAGEGLQGST